MSALADTQTARGLREVKQVWGNIAATSSTGQFKEAKQLRLLLGLWYDDALRAEFIDSPKDVLLREAGFAFPDDVKVQVVADEPDLFHFVLPRKPPAEETMYRYQEISDWWMVGHSACYFQLREGKDLAAVDTFRQGLWVMIIVRTWQDPAFRQAMLTNPKEALTNELGSTFPPSLRIKAPEDTESTTHLVIPRRPAEQDLLDQSEHPGAWFAAMHNFWYFLNVSTATEN